jgi:hypothetical protein
MLSNPELIQARITARRHEADLARLAASARSAGPRRSLLADRLPFVAAWFAGRSSDAASAAMCPTA